MQTAAKPAAPPKSAVAPEDRDDLFEPVPEGDAPNYTIVGAAPAEPSELFAVRLPPPTAQAGRYNVTPPPGNGRSAAVGAVKLPEGFQALPQYGAAADGWPLRIRCEADGSVMAYVPGGPAVLGTDHGPANAGPQVVLELDPFYIDVNEITPAQYETCRQELLEDRKPAPAPPQPPSQPDNHPVTGVSWRDAVHYAHWAGKELPTEAQWEKAARTEAGFAHPWGDGPALWPRTRTPEQIEPAGAFRTDQSAYGVMDLAGNAREWVTDAYSEQGHREAAQQGGVLKNWSGGKRTTQPNLRVIKGNGPAWNVWHRTGDSMGTQLRGVGFRCVLTLSDEK